VSVLGTRAVELQIEPGNEAFCELCRLPVKFVAKADRRRQVVCNVYVNDRWDRVEHYHERCYHDAGQPHGPVLEKKPGRLVTTAKPA